MISEVKPSAITIPSTFGRTRAVFLTGFRTAVAVALAFAVPTPQWARHAPGLAVYLAVVALPGRGRVGHGSRSECPRPARGNSTPCSDQAGRYPLSKIQSG